MHFVVNAKYSEILNWLSRASIGLSTMVDEHFGINVVEFMVRFTSGLASLHIKAPLSQAAGVIPIAHASGGPLLDIIVPLDGEPTGYHATSPETFAEAFRTVFTLPKAAALAVRQRARTIAVQKFSAEEFEKGWDASGWKAWLAR